MHVPSYLSGFRPSSARMRFVSSMLTSSPFFFSFLPPRSRSSSLCRFLSSLSLCLHRTARQYYERLGSEKLPVAICEHARMIKYLSLFSSLACALSLSRSLSLPLSRSLGSLSCPRSLSLLCSPWRSLSLSFVRSLSRCLQPHGKVSSCTVWHGIRH